MIYLKYGTYTGTTRTLTSYQSYNPLKCMTYLETEREAGRTLRKNEFNHLLSKRYIYKITISADELYSSSNFNFLKNFYNANGGWQLSTTGTGTNDFFEVVLKEAGEMPVTYLEENMNLPELTFTLIDKVKR